MALDTREKRMNAARVGRPWMRAKHAVGATDQQSRIGSSNAYGGNALSAGTSVGHLIGGGLLTSRLLRSILN